MLKNEAFEINRPAKASSLKTKASAFDPQSKAAPTVVAIWMFQNKAFEINR